uniref:Zinc knuckle CX2CX4HX4C domain-containing protein n=1 Tax=Fagus sylvatica TaxID=28930 RepID=A0A2N9HZ94_FAGSY
MHASRGSITHRAVWSHASCSDCHVAILSSTPAPPPNPPRFSCAYPFSDPIFEGSFGGLLVLKMGHAAYRRKALDVYFPTIPDQTGDATGEPRVPRRSRSHYLSNAPGLADQLVASRKDSAREGGSPDVGFRRSWYRRKACAAYFCKVPDSRESELGLVRYGPANRGHRGVFGPLEDIFPIGIPARPGRLCAQAWQRRWEKFQEFSAQPSFRRPVFTCVVDVAPDVGFRRSWYRRKACATYFSTVQALHRGELGFARYDLANRGRWNVPYAKGFDHNLLVSRPFSTRKVPNRSSHHAFQNGQGAVSSIQLSAWSTVRSNLGQTWSTLVKLDRFWSKLSEIWELEPSSDQAGSVRAVSFCVPTPEKISRDSILLVDMEPIEDMWKRFTLSEKEGLDVDLANTTQQSENILVENFLTPRVLNIDSVARTFKPLWKTKRNFSVQDLGRNKVALVFYDEVDLERIHNIHVRRMTEEFTGAIGRTLGQVERVTDRDDERGGENCMRVRVRMDITTPLCCGRMIRMEERKKRWAAFRYERLPNFCYWCGHLDHAEKDCDEGLRHWNTNPPEELQYGAWLRAEMDHPPHMEIEENPGIPNFVPSHKPNPEIFAEQLCEIDEAINYVPNKANPESTNPSLVNPARESLLTDTHVTQNSPIQSVVPRGILNDITNGLPSNTSSLKTRTAKWKMLAQAHGTNPVKADPSCHLKRSPLLLEPYTIKEKKKKKSGHAESGDGTSLPTVVVLKSTSEEISVEAGLQLCQQL